MVVATTILKKDDVIAELCLSKGIECFRGSEDNVLERYYLCAQKYNFKNIVRLTGDNPFTDIEELDNLINLHNILILLLSAVRQKLKTISLGLNWISCKKK